MQGTPKRGRRMGGDAAHQKAMLANLVASLIAAAVLFQFGTGALRGFAVTLTLGLLEAVDRVVAVEVDERPRHGQPASVEVD